MSHLLPRSSIPLLAGLVFIVGRIGAIAHLTELVNQ